MLDLTSQRLEKIGPFTVSNDGETRLSNRLLTARLPLLESENIPSSSREIEHTLQLTHLLATS